MQKVVIYKRLSKEDKTRTQHGFDSQQRDIDFFLSQGDYSVVDTFEEFISGGEDTKPSLEKAISICKEHNAILVVSKLDRLSRRVSQIAQYMEGDIKFKVASLPQADNFQLHLYAALSEQERTVIRSRVKSGLAAAKAKGILIGAASPKYNKKNHVSKSRNHKTTTHLVSIKDNFQNVISLMENKQLKENKLTTRNIAANLNMFKVSSTTGNPWNAGSVSRAREFYRKED